jgi:long-chain fatty acid transport protein
MARGILKLATALLAMSASIGAAQAGGFGRGTADTEILYEDGNFNMRAGATIVSPTRKFTSNPGNPALVGTDYTDTYAIPSAAIKLNVTDDLRCAATFVNVYGGDAGYAAPNRAATPTASGFGKVSENFTINEAGATCGYKFAAGKGNFWILGGLFQDTFDYARVNAGNPTGTVPINLTLGGTDIGFRVGAAYEIPEIALRAQLMYRSSTSYGATGTLVHPVFGARAATGTGKLPQSVELKLQSGIAPGWLAFGSVKWTDWSVTEQLVVRVPSLGIVDANRYFWKDGWTVSLGVGHAFNEKLSGAVQVTWDQGVKTGFDLSSTTWTLGTGIAYKDDLGGELRFGVGATYISGAKETKYLNTLADGFNTSVGGGMAYAASASYKVKW